MAVDDSRESLYFGSRPSTTPTAAPPCSPATNCATASPERIGTDERTLADTPVLDPARTVQTDFSKVLQAEEIPQNVRVSGHIYDIDTGPVTTVVDAKSRK